MRAADKEAELRQVPAHTFDLGPGAWATAWDARPLESIRVGLRRLSSQDRTAANIEAIARADRAFDKPALRHRRHPDDPLWRETWEVAYIHYLLGYALCHPQDATRALWPDQDGHLMLVDVADRDGKPGGIPITSRRFSDAGLVRCYDELENVERLSGVLKRSARDGEIARLGAELADGSLLATLREHPSPDARAVEAHARVLLAQVIDLVTNGRESPHPSAS